ncbi:NTP pyrophosphatase (non-canonical NTP hydrolase) [Kitasatospora acidiphila]
MISTVSSTVSDVLSDGGALNDGDGSGSGSGLGGGNGLGNGSGLGSGNGLGAGGALSDGDAVGGAGKQALSLDELTQRLARFAAARRWQPFHTPKNLAAALTVEAGELLEIFQWLTPDQAAAVMADPEQAHRVRDEVADVLAYLLQFCAAVQVDPLVALADKIDRNELRFPPAPQE